MDKLGRVLVYTGEGKGKSSQALGVAVRMAGMGKKVAIVYFDQGFRHDRERYFLDLYQGYVEYFLTGLDKRDSDTGEFCLEVLPEEIVKASKGLRKAREYAQSGNYDVLILEEINVLAAMGIVSCKEILDMIVNKPAYLNMILTGRNCPDCIMEKADFVTEIREIHRY